MGLKSSKTDEQIKCILAKHEALSKAKWESASNFVVLYKALMIEDEDKRIQTLRTLIESGKDVNGCWSGGITPMLKYEIEGLTVLMEAARYGYVDCVQLLLNAGAKVNQADYQKTTALLKAASKKNFECMKLLLEAGADVDQSSIFGDTALIYAACYGDDKCVRLLIEAGANVNHLASNEGTALIISARLGYVKCMELLLEAGADVNSVDTRGNTALICCLHCHNQSKVKACLKLLIDAGADIDVKNNNLQPIDYALRLWEHSKFLAEYLISENCSLNQASYDPVMACYVQLKEEDRLDILNLLFACGLPRHLCQSFIVEQDTSIRNWVETVASQTNTLKSICVFEIRKTLGPGIKSKVTKLNLPNVIQNLILLKGILSLECFD